MKQICLLVCGILFGANAFADINVFKKVSLANASSYSCYTSTEETSGYDSSVTFYIGKYEVDAEGNRTFNYYSNSLSFNTSSELCKRLKLITPVNENPDYAKTATTLYINENDELVGFDDPSNKNIVLMKL